MLADDLAFGGDDDALGIHPHADRAIGEGCWYAVAVAVDVDQACRRDALGVFDEAVEWPRKSHQMLGLFKPDIGERAGL